MDNLTKFIDAGISFYTTYMDVTSKQLHNLKEHMNEEFFQLMAAEQYYAGRIDSLTTIKSYLEVTDAKTDN